MAQAPVSLLWALPFIGSLLSIAFLPLMVPGFWHHHYPKVAAFWAVTYLLPAAYHQGLPFVIHEVIHVYGQEFLPFIILLGTLYVLSSHIVLKVEGNPTPTVNSLFLLGASLSANILGTVGASMIFIKPFLTLNQQRHYKVHSLIFFIFLVCNIGGCLTAVGDPPLFLGFLNGVDFFWPLKNLLLPFCMVGGALLGIYWLLDTYLYGKESPLTSTAFNLGLTGYIHIFLLMGAIALIIFSGVMRDMGSLTGAGLSVKISDLIRDGGLIIIGYVSYTRRNKTLSSLDWRPLKEVGYLFAGIFITASPVITILKSGSQGALGFLIDLVSDDHLMPLPKAYFWVTGALSSFLDNAPTYLIFYNLVGAPAPVMMTTLSSTLVAISAGSVFMGAMTYIGNAPNFMVKSLAETHGVCMPSFFKYMLWSVGILLPLFYLMTSLLM